MERRIAKITLYEAVDADKIQDWIDAGDKLIVDVDRSYTLADVPMGLVGVFPDQFTPFGNLYTEALKNALHAAAWVHAAGSFYFKVKLTASKNFSVDGYLWASDDVGDTSPIPDGTVLLAEFTTPGLPDSVKTVIALPYNQAISPADFVVMNDLGLTLQAGSTGSNFRITGKTACTVRFFQPTDSTVNYLVDFNAENQIIS